MKTNKYERDIWGDEFGLTRNVLYSPRLGTLVKTKSDFEMALLHYFTATLEIYSCSGWSIVTILLIIQSIKPLIVT